MLSDASTMLAAASPGRRLPPPSMPQTLADQGCWARAQASFDTAAHAKIPSVVLMYRLVVAALGARCSREFRTSCLTALVAACALVWGAAALRAQTAATQSPQELLKEAVTFHEQGKLEEAIRDYELFLDIYPDAPEVRSNLGAALVATGRYLQAIEEYKLALMKKPDPKVRLNLALAYYKTDDFADAVAELEKVHEEDKDNRQVELLLADSYVRQGDNKKAIDLLSPLFAASTSDLAVDYILGTAFARDGQAEVAQRVISPLLTGPDSAEKHMLLGTARFASHDYPGALEELRNAAEMNPDLPEVNSYYGQALFSNGHTEESREIFERELKRNPNDFQSNIHMGLLLKQDQKYDDALKAFKRALASHPGDLAVRYQIALVKMAQGKDQVARDELEQIVTESPKFLEAHVSLSTLYYRLKLKEAGNREREIVQRLTAERQAEQPAVRATEKGADGKAGSLRTNQ
jgi:tetratricopeptide (TPR) repeat protein